MIYRISFKAAVQTMLLFFTVALVFHLLVISQIIPFDIVWGGRLHSLEQMRIFESVSIIINLFILWVVAIKGGYLTPFLPVRLVNGILWIMLAMFVLNTVGNVFSVSRLEALLFTPITLLSAVFCYRMVVDG